MRYKFMRFPGGKPKAITLSYDDGIRADVRLCEILNKYGLKCTFNVNTSHFEKNNNQNKLSPDEIKQYFIDAGHEIAVHGESHIAPGIADPVRAITDVLNCRVTLEKEFKMIIRGMAYPDSGITRLHGENNFANIEGYLKNLGIVYSRTLGADNNNFLMPDNWYSWVPTAHHNNKNLMEWADSFVSLNVPELYFTRQYPRLFYLWGHSYEFDNNDNWNVIEDFCKTVANRDDIWYATNMEIYEYAQAYNSLVTSADCTRIYNPSLIEVFITVDTKDYSIKPGETIVLN